MTIHALHITVRVVTHRVLMTGGADDLGVRLVCKVPCSTKNPSPRSEAYREERRPGLLLGSLNGVRYLFSFNRLGRGL